MYDSYDLYTLHTGILSIAERRQTLDTDFS